MLIIVIIINNPLIYICVHYDYLLRLFITLLLSLKIFSFIFHYSDVFIYELIIKLTCNQIALEVRKSVLGQPSHNRNLHNIIINKLENILKI